MDDYKKQITELKNSIKKNSEDIYVLKRQYGLIVFESEAGEEVLDKVLFDTIQARRSRLEEIKKDIELLDDYHSSIEQSEEEIRELDRSRESLIENNYSQYEKIGVELYKIYDPSEDSENTLSPVYKKIQENQKSINDIENRLYQIKNSVTGKKLFQKVTDPVRIISLERKVKNFNRITLNLFREFGQVFCDSEMIDDATDTGLQETASEYLVNRKALRDMEKKKSSIRDKLTGYEESMLQLTNGIRYKRRLQALADEENLFKKELDKEYVEYANSSMDSEPEDENLSELLGEIRSLEGEMTDSEKQIAILEETIEIELVEKKIKNLQSHVVDLENKKRDLDQVLEEHNSEIRVLEGELAERRKAIQG